MRDVNAAATGRGDRAVLTTHLSKWQFQPMHRSRGWRGTIRAQRVEIERLSKDDPSLRREIPQFSREEYGEARRAASDETGFAIDTFPDSPPYAADQILDQDFHPGAIDET